MKASFSKFCLLEIVVCYFNFVGIKSEVYNFFSCLNRSFQK